jgi:hypothetical protein
LSRTRSRSLGPLPAPASGSMSLNSFLMESSYSDYDFKAITVALRSGAPGAALALALEGFREADDQKDYAFQFTIPVHERRHFFDIASTPLGINLFLRNWMVKQALLELLTFGPANRRILRLPLRDWIGRGDCPSAVARFVHMRDAWSKDMHHVMGDAKPRRTRRPSTAVPPVSLVHEIDSTSNSRCRPGMLLAEGGKYWIYPICGAGIFEALAWLTQNQWMAMAFGDSIARDWWSEFLASRGYWQYTVLNGMAMTCCDGNSDDIAQILEFALMAPGWPASIDDHTASRPEQLDPAWRLYELFSLLRRSTSPRSIADASAELCRARGWITPAEVVEKTAGHLESLPTTNAPADPLLSVLHDFKGYALQGLEYRSKVPLMTLSSYLRSVESFRLPPLHRVSLPGSPPEFRCDRETPVHRAWLDFFVLAGIESKLSDGKRIRCPMGAGTAAATAPGRPDCKCGNSAQRCWMHGLLDSCRVQFAAVT